MLLIILTKLTGINMIRNFLSFRIYCDSIGCEKEDVAIDVKCIDDAIKYFQHIGWCFQLGSHLCPRCVEDNIKNGQIEEARGDVD